MLPLYFEGQAKHLLSTYIMAAGKTISCPLALHWNP